LYEVTPRSGSRSLSTLEAVEVNGKLFPANHRLDPGVRWKFTDPEQTLIVKVDDSYTGTDVRSQCKCEQEIWDEVKDTPDAQFFTPVLSFGTFTLGGCMWDWNVSPFVDFAPDFAPGLKEELIRQAYYIAGRYNLSDWHPNQMKPICEGYSFVIHDYGFRHGKPTYNTPLVPAIPMDRLTASVRRRLLNGGQR